MPSMFGHTSNLAFKLFSGPMLPLTFVQLLKYASIVNKVTKLILDSDVEVSFIWPCNTMGHNEDVVSAWGVFVTSHIRCGRNFLSLYKYRFFSI